MPKRFMQQRDMQVQSEHRLSHALAFMERADLVRLHQAYRRGARQSSSNSSSVRLSMRPAVTLPPGTSPTSKLDLGPFKAHSMG